MPRPASAAGLVVIVLLAACGAQSADEPAAPASELEVVVWPDGRGADAEVRATLTCEPAGGTHPVPEAACDALAENEDALEPVPDDAICTQIYGGPAEARIAGTFRGRELDVMLRRTNGCEISRWDALAPVVALESS